MIHTMSVVDDYLETVPAPQRVVFEAIRRIAHKTIPQVEEAISYGMPAFKYKGKYVAGFYAYKDHLSFFPTAAPIEEFKDKLAGYKTSSGTIQFTADHPIPDILLTALIQHRVDAINSK